MSQYIINDVELEIDMEDAEFQERYEKAFDRLGESEKELQKVGSCSNITRSYCSMFYQLFDDIFGPGTGESLFKKKYNSRICEEVFDEFLHICKKQVEESERRRTKVSTKYNPRRRK